MWDIGKAEFRGKFIVLTIYIRKEERPKINDKNLGGLEEKEKMPRNIAHSRVHATVTQKPIFFF